MQHLHIALLGPPLIRLNDRHVQSERHKAIALLAYLAAENRAHRRESLATLLWPDYPPKSAFSYLRRTLWELNKLLGKGWVEADRENIWLVRQPSLELDIETFKQLINQPGNLLEALSEAVLLYRGEFLEGLILADTAPFEEWQYLQAESYLRDLRRLLEKLVLAYEDRGDYEQALPYAQRWLLLDWLDESANRAVMRQLAGMGDRNGAIRTYQSCSQHLQDELGIAPEPETEA
jgi:DNA-binding SARP family transcriptional activator